MTLTRILTDYANSKSPNSQAGAALHCWNGSTKEYFPVEYATLSRRAFAFGARLQKAHTEKVSVEKSGSKNAGESGAQAQPTAKPTVVMLACHSPYATLLAFYGAISAGMIPMIFSMPLSMGSHRALSDRIKHWGDIFDDSTMLVLEEGLDEKFHAELPAQLPIVRLSDDPSGDWPELASPCNGEQQAEPDDVAFFQTTSSSTGDHKAVAISHANILANVSGIRRAQQMGEHERMISWLPLFHDMGLVGAVLFSFCNNYPLFLMTPTQFIKRPALWLKGMSEQACTIATAPNFGYDYCVRLISDKDIANLDLSAVKHLFIGAEPIRVSTVQGFVEKFSVAGISAKTIRPAYGLAESTIITSMTKPHEVSNFLKLDGSSITINQPVKVLDKLSFDDPRMSDYNAGQDIAACSAGVAIDDLQIEIINEQGEPVAADGIAGEIAISGSSVALGYVGLNSEVADRVANHQQVDYFGQSRLGTGDMGVIVDGELYVVERIKNLIIRNGENFFVSALEQQLAELLSISHEHIAVFESNIHDPASDIVVLVERHAALDDNAIDALLVAMPKEAFPINRILLSKSREIPRTTSGKKRHFYCRQLYAKEQVNYQQAIDITPLKIAEAIARSKSD